MATGQCRRRGKQSQTTLVRVEQQLLAWFAEHGRDLPWRRHARSVRDPRLGGDAPADAGPRVVPRYTAWLERWPTVDALAAAPPADVIRAWQGLGYNRRALNLHRAARHVAEHGWPDDLTELPGVGRYTADAVGAFAFGRPVLPVDVNIRRVQRRTGVRVRPRVRAGALRPRRDGLPGTHSALRRVSAGGALPLAGHARRARAPAGAARRLVPPAAGRHAAPGRRRRSPAHRARRRRRRVAGA